MLAKVSLTSANQDTLLYEAPANGKATVTLNLVNRSGSTVETYVAIMEKKDFSLQTAAIVAKGAGYTAIPTLTVNGECTTQAVVSVVNMCLASFEIDNSGSGYEVGDVITVGATGATASTSATIKVETISVTGGITSASIVNAGVFTALGSGAGTLTGGKGTTASLKSLTYGINTIAIATKGNGYKEAPTISSTGNGTATFSTTVVRIVKPEDYIEFRTPIVVGQPLERTGIILRDGQSLWVRSSVANAINAHLWGVVSSL